MAGSRAPKYELAIGELFPDDDVVAHWVFSVTVLVEDLAVLVPSQQKAKEQNDLRVQIVFYRQMLTRLFEARRLVTAVDKYPDLKRFAGPLLSGPNELDLREYYLRPADGSPSVIEDLYGQIRHRSVHYMKVGQAELASVLREFARYPARITAETRERRQTIEFQWVQAISAVEVLGDVTDDEFLANMRRSAEVAASVAVAWMMLGPIALIGFTHERGIDFERLAARPPRSPRFRLVRPLARSLASFPACAVGDVGGGRPALPLVGHCGSGVTGGEGAPSASRASICELAIGTLASMRVQQMLPMAAGGRAHRRPRAYGISTTSCWRRQPRADVHAHRMRCSAAGRSSQ